MTDTEPSAGRSRQKHRTREALLAAARALLADSTPVTLHAAAARAGVSRATAYRYFSDPSVLAAEAGLALEVQGYEEVTAQCRDTRARLLAITLYFLDLALAHEPEFRRFLARWLDAWAPDAVRVRRGGRRVAMIQRALDEAVRPIADADRAALTHGLCVATGTEAMIALLDVAGAAPAEARDSVAGLAAALIDRYLPPGA